MSEPLSFWNQTPIRQVILDFVAAVATRGSPDFVPPAEPPWLRVISYHEQLQQHKITSPDPEHEVN